MPVQFETIAVGPLQSNCHIIWDADTREAAIIDPGDDREVIEPVVADNTLSVKHILLTHGHFDHCIVAGDLAREYGVGVSMHESDVEDIQGPSDIAEMFYDASNLVSFLPETLLNDGDVIQLGNSPIEVIHTPGHSPGGLCFVTDAGVFCGDTIFAGSIGRTDFPGGSHPQLIASIHAKILSMKDETPLYPGHGPATTVGRERATNPWL